VKTVLKATVEQPRQYFKRSKDWRAAVPMSIETTQNPRLRAVPSYHYSGAFARRVRRVVEDFAPDAIALELPTCAAGELEWALQQWPRPAASLCDVPSGGSLSRVLFPFVAGDSILEAARLASAGGISAPAIDLPLAVQQSIEPIREARLVSGEPQWPDAAWCERVGWESEAWQALLEEWSGPPSPLDEAREAHMARALCGLLDAGRRVLWVGGAAHWARLRRRVGERDFGSKYLPSPWPAPAAPPIFERVHLEPSALLFLTGVAPFLSQRYARTEDAYDEAGALGEAAAQALRPRREHGPLLLLESPAQGADDGEEGAENSVARGLEEELCVPADAARVLVYARNLAATRGPRVTPRVGEMLRAALGVVGPFYGGRLFDILVGPDNGAPKSNQHEQDVPGTLPSLSYRRLGDESGLWRGGELVLAAPFWPAAGGEAWVVRPTPPLEESWPPTFEERGGSGNPLWLCHPSDRLAYRDFVRYALRVASQHAAREPRSEPLLVGLGDGIDARATLRARAAGRSEVWVREVAHAPLKITNAALDWEYSSEQAPALQDHSAEHGGWIDPSEYFSIGSASRERGVYRVLRAAPILQIDRRDWTLLTLDAGNFAEGDRETFYTRVIYPLVTVPREHDNIYEWLDIMFRFCAGKDFAYISHYVPSARIHAIARRHRVRVHHVPLSLIPRALLRRNRYFRFGEVSSPLWQDSMTDSFKRGI
jgi:hypothetical protein